jgi:hypothetical protein
VGDLKLGAIKETTKFRLAPGTTVAGTITVTTFFTKAADAPTSPTPTAAPVKR